MTAENDAADSDPSYRPPQPLWQPGPEKPTSPVLLGFIALAVLGVLAFITLGGESTFLASNSEPVEVTVLRVDGVEPPDDAPAYYRYWVRLPDGVETRYTSPDIHRVAEKILVMKSRGRVTGWVHLTRPQARRGPP